MQLHPLEGRVWSFSFSPFQSCPPGVVAVLESPSLWLNPVQRLLLPNDASKTRNASHRKRRANLSKPNRLSYSRRWALSADRGAENAFDRMHCRWSEGKQRAESSAILDNRKRRSLFTMATGANKAMLFSHDVCRLSDDMHGQFSTFVFVKPYSDSRVSPL